MAEKKTAAATKSATTTTKKATVYIGPNKLGEGLKKFTVYRGDVTEMVKGYTEKYANISRLFVSVEDLNTAMDDVKKQGTPLYLAYKEMERGE